MYEFDVDHSQNQSECVFFRLIFFAIEVGEFADYGNGVIPIPIGVWDADSTDGVLRLLAH